MDSFNSEKKFWKKNIISINSSARWTCSENYISQFAHIKVFESRWISFNLLHVNISVTTWTGSPYTKDNFLACYWFMRFFSKWKHIFLEILIFIEIFKNFWRFDKICIFVNSLFLAHSIKIIWNLKLYHGVEFRYSA